MFFKPNVADFRLLQPRNGPSPAVDAGVEENAASGPQADFGALRERTPRRTAALTPGRSISASITRRGSRQAQAPQPRDDVVCARPRRDPPSGRRYWR